MDLVSHSLHTAVIQIDMGNHHLLRQRLGTHTETVVLGGDFHSAGDKVLHRLVAAPMTEFELVCGAAVCQAKNLMTQVYAENRLSPS
jgi:hypothetical protein